MAEHILWTCGGGSAADLSPGSNSKSEGTGLAEGHWELFLKRSGFSVAVVGRSRDPLTVAHTPHLLILPELTPNPILIVFQSPT